MSLFKARDLWSTQCGDEEIFDFTSLIVANLSGNSDVIVLGSQSGYLRVFNPSISHEGNMSTEEFRPADLMIEMHLQWAILQVAVGKLVSGSRGQHLCLLLPRSVAVYSLITKAGATDHGDQNRLTLIYEHPLHRSAYCMVVGPYGGTQGRDFICVQSLDGTLAFYEQETFAFTRFLPNFLLPGPLAYHASTDSFITASSSWCIESYRYQALADGKEVSNKQDTVTSNKISADWSYNLGEPVLDIQIVLASEVSFVMILGERNLFCLMGGGSLKFMKRLEYKPCCFYTYLNETNERVMTLVATETNTMLVYEHTTLRWSSQLPFPPVVITRGDFGLAGMLVFLSDSGQLQCCYLGTEPALFVAPPLDSDGIDYETCAEELIELQKTIKHYSKANSSLLAKTATDRELSISVEVSAELEPCAFKTTLDDNPNTSSGGEPLPMVRVVVLLSPHTPLNKVQVSLAVELPLEVNQVSHMITSLCNATQVLFFVYHVDEKCDVPTMEVRVVTSYMTVSGIPRVIQTPAKLPLSLVAACAPPEKEAEFKVTININRPCISLSQLFPEFTKDGEISTGSTSAGFRYLCNHYCSATILTAKTSQRYRLQSNNLPSLCLFTSELVSRLNKDFLKDKEFSCSYSSSLPIHELLNYIDTHFMLRLEARKIQEELALRASQFRVIQRRLLTKFKDKTPRPLANLDLLLKDTHTQILRYAQELEVNQEALVRASCQLSCVVRLIFLLLKVMNTVSETDYSQLAAAAYFSIHDTEEQGWEEVTEASLSFLLRTMLTKTTKDQQNSKPITLDYMKDATRLKKHISTAFDRITKASLTRRPTNIPSIPEDVEEDVSLPVGSQYGERMLSASKQVLLTRRRKLSQDGGSESELTTSSQEQT